MAATTDNSRTEWHMVEMMTAPEASKKLGVAVGTIKNWAERVGVGTKNSMGVWFFSDREIHVLEVVKSLREGDCGFDTITRRLQTEPTPSDSRQQEPAEGAGPTLPGLVSTMAEAEGAAAAADIPEQQPLADQRDLVSGMLLAIKEQTEALSMFREQADQVGTLREQLGEMRERLKWITAERDFLQREVGLLKAPPDEQTAADEALAHANLTKTQVGFGTRLRHAWQVFTGG